MKLLLTSLVLIITISPALSCDENLSGIYLCNGPLVDERYLSIQLSDDKSEVTVDKKQFKLDELVIERVPGHIMDYTDKILATCSDSKLVVNIESIFPQALGMTHTRKMTNSLELTGDTIQATVTIENFSNDIDGNSSSLGAPVVITANCTRS